MCCAVAGFFLLVIIPELGPANVFDQDQHQDCLTDIEVRFLSLFVFATTWQACWWRPFFSACHSIKSRCRKIKNRCRKIKSGCRKTDLLRTRTCFLSLSVFQCYKWFWSCLPLWTATCLHSVSYTTLFFWHPHAENTMQTQDSWLSHYLLLWTPHLEFTPTRP